VTLGFTNIDDFSRFLKFFGDFWTKTEWKLAEIGGFWVLFEHPHFPAKKGVEKSRGKIRRFSKKLCHEVPRAPSGDSNRGLRGFSLIINHERTRTDPAKQRGASTSNLIADSAIGGQARRSLNEGG